MVSSENDPKANHAKPKEEEERHHPKQPHPEQRGEKTAPPKKQERRGEADGKAANVVDLDLGQFGSTWPVEPWAFNLLFFLISKSFCDLPNREFHPKKKRVQLQKVVGSFLNKNEFPF